MYHYLGDNKGIVKTNRQLKLYVNTKEKSISPHLITDSFWEPNISNFVYQLIKPGMQIIEIGANIGYYTTMFAAMAGENGYVHAFEPNHDVFNILCDNIEVNGLKKVVTLHERAVSDHVGFEVFTSLLDHQVSSSLLSPDQINKVENGMYHHEKKKQTQVVTTTIDCCLPNINVDFMKIDAEGFEYHIFRGMPNLLLRNPKLKMLVEFVPEYLNLASENGAENLLTLITSLGYKLQYINTSGQARSISTEDVLKKHYLELFLEK